MVISGAGCQGFLGPVLKPATYLLCTNLVNLPSWSSRFVSGEIIASAFFGLPHLVPLGKKPSLLVYSYRR